MLEKNSSKLWPCQYCCVDAPPGLTKRMLKKLDWNNARIL